MTYPVYYYVKNKTMYIIWKEQGNKVHVLYDDCKDKDLDFTGKEFRLEFFKSAPFYLQKIEITQQKVEQILIGII